MDHHRRNLGRLSVVELAEHKRPAGVVVCKLAGLELRQLFLDVAAVVGGGRVE